MKTSYFYIIALFIFFSFGMLANSHSAFAQTINAKDAAILNAQLKMMEKNLLEIQQQLALRKALEDLRLTLDITRIKIQNNEINPETAKAINTIVAGIEINLTIINSNLQAKPIAAAKKKTVQNAARPAPVQKVQKETSLKPETTAPLTASVESTIPESSIPWKTILEIIGLVALIGFGYFAWNKRNYLLTLVKLHKNGTSLDFSKIQQPQLKVNQKEKITAFLKPILTKAKEKLSALIYKEKSA